MNNEFKTAIRLHRPHAFYKNFEEGPFVYRCHGCLQWRQKEEHERCPNCGGTWEEIWEPPEEVRKALMEIRRKPTIRFPEYHPTVCANPECQNELPRGHQGSYCDLCSNQPKEDRWVS